MTTIAGGSRRRLDGTGALWRRLAADLRHRLDAGEFELVFPGEFALAEQYGVSRHTVREALRDLRREGLVTAARGRASRVAEPTLIEQPTDALYSLFTSVEAAGLSQRSLVREQCIRSDAAAAAELGLAAGTELFYLERLRLAGDEPLAIDQAWLPAELTSGLLTVDFGDTSLYEQLQLICGIRLTGGRERIRATVPTPTVRADLGVPETVATLAVDRLGCSDGVPVEWRHTVLRGDLFSLTADFTAHTYRFDSTTKTRGGA